MLLRPLLAAYSRLCVEPARRLVMYALGGEDYVVVTSLHLASGEVRLLQDYSRWWNVLLLAAARTLFNFRLALPDPLTSLPDGQYIIESRGMDRHARQQCRLWRFTPECHEAKPARILRAPMVVKAALGCQDVTAEVSRMAESLTPANHFTVRDVAMLVRAFATPHGQHARAHGADADTDADAADRDDIFTLVTVTETGAVSQAYFGDDVIAVAM
jgi:hypothetical protein